MVGAVALSLDSEEAQDETRMRIHRVWTAFRSAELVVGTVGKIVNVAGCIGYSLFQLANCG